MFEKIWLRGGCSGILWAGWGIKYLPQVLSQGSGLFGRERETMSECTHTSHIHKVTPHTKGCEECLKMGDTWVHLRLCMECGHVGCCDSSKNKHATKHFHRTKHPIMRSIEPGETWGWCFVDEVELDFA